MGAGHSYTYDSDSNRASVVDALTAESQSYTYWPATQRLKQINKAGVRWQTFDWTPNGEQSIVKTYDSSGEEVVETQTCAWSADGTLKSASYAGGSNDQTSIFYAYDHQGTLISRKVTKNGQVLDWERYVVDYHNLTGYSQVVATCSVDPQTGENRIKRFNFFTDQIVSQNQYSAGESFTQYLHGDALGTIRTVNRKPTSSSSLSATQLNYTAFGETLGSTTRPIDYAFTGQFKDAISGMQYHRARWLETRLGAWTSLDIYCDFFGNFGSGYKYCEPVNRKDLSGTFSLIEMQVSAVISDTLNSMSFDVGQGALNDAAGIAPAASVYAENINEVMFWANFVQVTAGVAALTVIAKRALVYFYKALQSRYVRRVLGEATRTFVQAAKKAPLEQIQSNVVFGHHNVQLIKVKGKTYKSINADYTNNPESVYESIGRFAPGQFGECTYHSLEPETSILEVAAHAKEPGKMKKIYENEVELDGILDLTDPKIAEQFPELSGMLEDSKEAVETSWAFAKELKEQNVRGIKYPSIRNPGGSNIVVFETVGTANQTAPPAMLFDPYEVQKEIK